MARPGDRPILPIRPNSQRTRPLARGRAQVPATLQLPSSPLLDALPRLAGYLRAGSVELLPVPPPAMTVHEVANRPGQFELQVHIPPELTNAPAECKALQDAIRGFIGAARKGAITGPPYSIDNPNGPDSVVAIRLALPDPQARQTLDEAMVDVLKVARLIQALGGDAARITAILTQHEVVNILIATVVGVYAPFRVCGWSPRVETFATGWTCASTAIERSVQRLQDAGHFDLAMLVLTAAIQNTSNADEHGLDKVPLVNRFVSNLMSSRVLDNDHDFESALDVLDSVLCDPSLDTRAREHMLDAGFDLVHRFARMNGREAAPLPQHDWAKTLRAEFMARRAAAMEAAD